MARTVTTYSLLLSCPGDAYKVCYPMVKTAVDEFNKYAMTNLSIIVDLTHWSTDSFPQSGGHPQALLNSQIVDSADAAIAIFWTRFGTPTDDYGSGTEEEIDRLINDKKQVFLYFLDKAVPPSLTDSEDYQEQRRKIAAFKQKYVGQGIYCVVSDETSLREQFARHLAHYFTKRMAEDSGLSQKSDESKLTLLAANGSKEAAIQRLSFEMEQQVSKESIVRKICFAQSIIVPAAPESENGVGGPMLQDKASVILAGVSEPWKYGALLSYKKNATISDDSVADITNFCSESGIEIADGFWDLGGLEIHVSPQIDIMSGENGTSLVGSDEAKNKYDILSEIADDIYTYNDSNNYYKEMESLKFVELILRNTGTAFDEDIEVNLALPHDSLIQADEFPVPIIELEEIVESDRIKHWICPMATADIDEYEHSPKKLSIPSFSPPIMPFQRRDYEEEYKLKKIEYIERIKDLFEWGVFDQGETDIVRIKIRKLNQFKSMHLPARIFLKNTPDKISYSIKAKHTSSIIEGDIAIRY